MLGLPVNLIMVSASPFEEFNYIIDKNPEKCGKNILITSVKYYIVHSK
jgi:hypothetical protein